MSKIKNIGLDQYGAEPFEQQRFGTDGIGWVDSPLSFADMSIFHRVYIIVYRTIRFYIRDLYIPVLRFILSCALVSTET